MRRLEELRRPSRSRTSRGYASVDPAAASSATMTMSSFSTRPAGIEVVIAVSDVSGGVYDEGGLDIQSLLRFAEQHGSLADWNEGDRLTNEELLELPCDILVLAAREDQIHADNAPRLQTRLIAEGANGSTSLEADAILVETRSRTKYVENDSLARQESSGPGEHATVGQELRAANHRPGGQNSAVSIGCAFRRSGYAVNIDAARRCTSMPAGRTMPGRPRWH